MDEDGADYSNTCCSIDNCETAVIQEALMFSVSQDAEPAIVEGGIYTYEHNSVIPKFYDTSVEEPDEVDGEKERAIVLSTTQPLRPFYKPISYGTQAPWLTSDNEYLSGGGDPGYTSAHAVSRQPRRPVGKVSTVLASWNVLNMMVSLSILAIPYAVASGGLVTVGVIPLVATMCGYTGKLLIDCMYEHSVSRRRYKTRVRLDYVEIGQDYTNSDTGGRIVQVLQVIDMLCACILNINVLGALCFEMFHNSLSIEVCSVIGVAIALPTFFINRLGLIAWMHLVGVTSLVVGLILVEGFCFASFKEWSFTKIPLYDLEKLPISFGIIVCSFGVHSALPGIEQQMEKPKQYRPMLVFAFVTAVIVKLLVGFTNALLYGIGTDEVITVDLEYHYRLGISSAVFIFLSVLCLFALPTFVIMEGIDIAIAEIFPFFKQYGNSCTIWISVFNRLLIMGLSLMVAILVPHFALLMSFIGNTITTLLSLVMPCLFHLRMKKDRLRWYHHVCNRLIVCLCVFSMPAGVFFTCKELNKQFRK